MSLSRIKSLLVLSLGLFAILFSTSTFASDSVSVAATTNMASTEATATPEHAAKKEGDFNVTETI